MNEYERRLERTRRFRLPIQEFALPFAVEEELDMWEKEALEGLTEAARGIIPIFNLQENQLVPGANFYPHDASVREIEEAANLNPEILSPYTVVERIDGVLHPVPYHEKYRNSLGETCEVLKRVAGMLSILPQHQDFVGYLVSRTRSLQTGDYERSEADWLAIPEETSLDIVIGPYDRYLDKLFNRKYVYQAWVGVLDKEETHHAQWFVNAFLAKWEEMTERERPKIRVRIDNTVIMTGLAGRFDWVANNLPCQPEWREKYGSKFTVFKPSFEDKFNSKTWPAFREVIDPEIRSGATYDFVKRTALRTYTGHEIGHSLEAREDGESRLGRSYLAINEGVCDVLSLLIYSKISEVTEKEKELAIALMFAGGAARYKDFQIRPEQERFPYLQAEAAILNFCLQDGSVTIKEGVITWSDPEKVFASIERLYRIWGSLMESGTAEAARKFLRNLAEVRVFSQLTPSNKSFYENQGYLGVSS